VAFLHWGNEYTDQVTDREKAIATSLAKEGAELIVGSHSHKASGMDCTPDYCRIFSLGNFFFDQSGEKVSGKILQLKYFPQGTYVPHLIDVNRNKNGSSQTVF
jgi:poly-gamma-glutamate capsule biosynthesis protein CapA/YwtB (metallophosphatase superfamily)